jgi:hypothetical protein
MKSVSVLVIPQAPRPVSYHVPSPVYVAVNKLLPLPEEEGDGEDAAADEVGVCVGVGDGGGVEGAGCSDEVLGVSEGAAELLGASDDEGAGGGVVDVVGATEEVVGTGGIEEDEGAGSTDEDGTNASDVDDTATELDDGAAPTLSAADEVDRMPTELDTILDVGAALDTTTLDVEAALDTTMLDVGTALLLSRVEVGLPALQRLIWRFRGTTEGATTGAESVSGEASLAAIAWRRWYTLRAMCCVETAEADTAMANRTSAFVTYITARGCLLRGRTGRGVERRQRNV